MSIPHTPPSPHAPTLFRSLFKRRRFWAASAAVTLLAGTTLQVVSGGPIQRAQAASTCTVAAAGDIAASGGNQAKTAAIVQSLNPTAVLTLGDNAYPNGSSSDFAKYYDPTWGKFKAITKPAPGNHEYYTPNASGYFSYFHVPAYYAYDLCGWRMYSLNRRVVGAERAAELAWYRADLAAHANTPKLAVWHEPRWTSGTKHGPDTSTQDLWAASVAGGVKVVLSGHEHAYERLGPMDASGRLDPNGTRQFVVGEGGNNGLSGFGKPLATSEVRIAGQQGVLSMTFRADGYDFALHQVGGSVADRGTVSFTNKQQATSTPTPSSSPTAPSTSPAVPSPKPTVPSADPTAPSSNPTVPATGTSGSFTAVEDAAVSENSASPTASATSLPVGGADGSRSRTYLKFSLSGIPAQATAIRASLSVTAASTGTIVTDVHQASSNAWTESGLTWQNQPGKTGTKIAGLAPQATGTTRTVNVSSAVKGNGTYSFVLNAGRVTGVSRFASSESSTPPVLTVTWTMPSGKVTTAPAPVVASKPVTAPTAAETTTPRETGTVTSAGRAWKAPVLSNPVTVHVSNSSHNLKLDSAKDYRIVMPSTVLDVGSGALTINGGRNVVLVGGELTSSGSGGSVRATAQKGTLHIEGLYISGAHLQEGLQFQSESDAVVQVVNVRIDTVHGSSSGHHADVLQTWGGGPKILRIDGLTAATEYQGFMLAGAASVSGWDFRHINIQHDGTNGWTIYDAAPKALSISMSEVYLQENTNNGVYSLGHKKLMNGISWGAPPGGDFVPAASTGLNYTG